MKQNCKKNVSAAVDLKMREGLLAVPVPFSNQTQFIKEAGQEALGVSA